MSRLHALEKQRRAAVDEGHFSDCLANKAAMQLAVSRKLLSKNPVFFSRFLAWRWQRFWLPGVQRLQKRDVSKHHRHDHAPPKKGVDF
jgi:hypothetical protein